MLPTEQALAARIDDHLVRTGQSETAFSLAVSKDKNLVRGLRAGTRNPRLKTLQAIIAELERAVAGKVAQRRPRRPRTPASAAP